MPGEAALAVELATVEEEEKETLAHHPPLILESDPHVKTLCRLLGIEKGMNLLLKKLHQSLECECIGEPTP